MAEMNNCLLGKKGLGSCDNECARCGWNPKVVAKRNAQIAAGGLILGKDGVRRLIIRKED